MDLAVGMMSGFLLGAPIWYMFGKKITEEALKDKDK